MRRGLIVVAIIGILAWVTMPVGSTWSDTGDRLYLEKAIEGLPKPVKKFYEDRESMVLERLSNPARGSRQIFEIDRLEAFPFEDVPESRELAIPPLIRRRFPPVHIGEAGLSVRLPPDSYATS